jgi:hypothetical protein
MICIQYYKINISELIFSYLMIHTSNICNNVLHDLTLVEMTIARFVGTGGFLIRYFNSHMT